MSRGRSFCMGVELAGLMDDRALEFLETTMNLDEMATGCVWGVRSALAASKGDNPAAKQLMEKSRDWYDNNQERIEALYTLRPGDDLRQVKDEEIVELAGLAAKGCEGMLAQAWIFNKPMPEWFDDRVWVIVQARLMGKMMSKNDLSGHLYEAGMEVGLPPCFGVLVLGKSDAWLLDVLQSRPELRIWGEGAQAGAPAEEQKPGREAA